MYSLGIHWCNLYNIRVSPFPPPCSRIAVWWRCCQESFVIERDVGCRRVVNFRRSTWSWVWEKALPMAMVTFSRMVSSKRPEAVLPSRLIVRRREISRGIPLNSLMWRDMNIPVSIGKILCTKSPVAFGSVCVNLLASFCAAATYWLFQQVEAMMTGISIRVKEEFHWKQEDPIYVWFLPFYYDGFLHGLHRRSRGLCLDGWFPNCRGKNAKLALQSHSARNQYIRFHSSGFLELRRGLYGKSQVATQNGLDCSAIYPWSCLQRLEDDHLANTCSDHSLLKTHF